MFGAAAQNLKVRVDAQLYKKQHHFLNSVVIHFDNPAATDFTSQSKQFLKVPLNNEESNSKTDFQSEKRDIQGTITKPCN